MLFPYLSAYSYCAILVSLYQFTLLFSSIGYVIPVRYLFGAFMCLQMLIGPMLAYNGLDKFQLDYYKMQIPEDQYFSYVIPAVIAFIMGLHIHAGKLQGEIINTDGIKNFVNQNPTVPFIFVGVGFMAGVGANLYPSGLAFVLYLLGNFKFIGAFMMIFGDKKMKIVPIVLVFGSIIVSSLGEAMFHDLLTWMIFLGSVLAIKYKPGITIKLIITIFFILITLSIQQLKGDYRTATWQRGEKAGIDAIDYAYESSKEKNAFFSTQSLTTSSVRFNQGFIITNIMKTVPSKVPFSNGNELMEILEAAFLPRILSPNKLQSGDQANFKIYSGLPLGKNTAMALSSVGDAYINFGVTGGCIFMFILALFYSEILNLFLRKSVSYPLLLLFTPLVFYFPIRPDCDLMTLLGHLIKSCFLIFVIFAFWKKYLMSNKPFAKKNINVNPVVSSSMKDLEARQFFSS